MLTLFRHSRPAQCREPGGPRELAVWPRRAVALCLLALCLSAHASWAEAAEPFIPEQPTIPAGALRTGEKGYMLTVLKGTKPVRIPVQVAGVIPQGAGVPRGEIRDFILVRILPFRDSRGQTVGLAQGMSGSPVFFRGKLAGAVGRGWEFSDHSLTLVTPIADMCGIFAAENEGGKKAAEKKMAATPITVSGVPASFLSQALGGALVEVPVTRGEPRVEPGRFRPGEAVAALLAWGDVEVAATGTVTATSKDGRFLAFGHSFLKRGKSFYPAARAVIHETVKSQAFPFKLASPASLVGTVTQDREAGIGGRTGFFAPSIPVTLVFRDRDRLTREERSFRVVADAWLSSKLLEGICAGLVEELWGRKGQGTMTVTLRIEGKGIRNGWTRNDVFFSEEDAGGAALKQSVQIMSAFLTQPFEDRMPLGFRLDVEATEEPRALIIEDVKVPARAKAGEELTVTVTLRPWRGKPITRDYKVKAPEGTSGVCELIVRGGGVHPLPQLAIDGGWKAIDSLDRMLEEIGAMDANNELFVELTSDAIAEAIKKASSKDSKEGKDGEKDAHEEANLLPEETEYLSQTKERRLKEGTLCIYRADRFVDGMIKRLVTVEPGNEEARPASDSKSK
ncbi:MAG: hypothetical protein K5841_08800 [Fretibacterium sp.]|nr:hypothetical protein [Fretibacterium sp.]